MTLTLPHRIVRRVRREFDQRRIEHLSRRYPLPTTTLDQLLPGQSSIHPPIMEDICMPPYYGFDDHDDYSALMHIATRLNPKVVVELGTAHGNTIANLCQHCPEARFYTVNAPVEEQTGDVVTFELQKGDIGRVYRNSGYEARVQQIFANTLHLDLSMFIPGPTVDLAIVDACHDEAFVLNDFLKVEPFVRPGGVVVLHDTHPSMNDHLKGSYVASMRLRKNGYDVRHLSGTWWGTWVKL
jgi:predicted O-methyltransferase YrrM